MNGIAKTHLLKPSELFASNQTNSFVLFLGNHSVISILFPAYPSEYWKCIHYYTPNIIQLGFSLILQQCCPFSCHFVAAQTSNRFHSKCPQLAKCERMWSFFRPQVHGPTACLCIFLWHCCAVKMLLDKYKKMWKKFCWCRQLLQRICIRWLTYPLDTSDSQTPQATTVTFVAYYFAIVFVI